MHGNNGRDLGERGSGESYGNQTTGCCQRLPLPYLPFAPKKAMYMGCPSQCLPSFVLFPTGIIPLGHISDDSEGQSSKSGIPFHSSPAYGSPFFSSAAGEEAHFAVGFPYNMTHGELYPDDFPFLQNGNPSPAVDYRKNRDSRRAPKGREELSSQLPHHRLLLEDPPSLFLCPDTPCPPLRCTRLLGMTAAQVYGVYSTPDVASVNISKLPSLGDRKEGLDCLRVQLPRVFVGRGRGKRSAS